MIAKKPDGTSISSMAALRKIARRLSIGTGLFDYVQVGLFKVPVQESEEPHPQGYSVVPGTFEHFHAIAKCREMTDEAQGESLFTLRMQKGALCFLLLDSSATVVGYAWVMTTVNLFEDDDRYTLFCSHTQAYIFDTFLQPGQRGKQLYRFLIGRVQQALLGQGRTEYFVLIDTANTTSMRAHQKIGALELERYRYTCLLGLVFQALRAKDETKRRIGFFHSQRLFESLTLPSSGISDFTLSVAALEHESDWMAHSEAISRLESDLEYTISPFHLFSAARIWWESDIQGRYPLFLVEIEKGPDRKLVGYGVFRLMVDEARFGKPKELIAFDDVYFMHGCFFIHSPEVSRYTLQKILADRRNTHTLRKITGADLLAWHRLLPCESALEASAPCSRWTVKKEADYPMLEIQDAQQFYAQPNVTHALHDIEKQEKRMRNAFSATPTIQSIDLGLLDEASLATVFSEFLQLLKKTWQYAWMEESPQVDVALYTSKLLAYTKLWAGSRFPVLYFLDLGDTHIAFLYALRVKDSCWCLMIGYDPAFKTYSPGKTVFLGMLRQMSESGVQHFHLGGNVVGWKNEWQSHCTQVSVQEYFINPKCILINGLKTLLDSCRNVLDFPRKHQQEPPRHHAS